MSPKIRYVLFIDGACNLVVLVAKATVGFKTGSLAILGDAIHSLADVANNVVALVVVRIASEPPDREHPYGHQKFETLAVFGLAMLLAVLAIEIVIRAIDRSGREVVQTGWGLAVMLGVLVVNMGPCTLGASLGSQTRLVLTHTTYHCPRLQRINGAQSTISVSTFWAKFNPRSFEFSHLRALGCP